ncbi:MAG: SH3 domain-containing protein [Aminivibrio sp.]
MHRFKALLVLIAILFPAAALAEDAPLNVLISGKSVNIRAEPSTKAAVAGRFAGGEVAAVLEVKHGKDPYPWYLVLSRKFWPGGPVAEGWVYGQFVTSLTYDNTTEREVSIMADCFADFTGKLVRQFGASPDEAVKKLGKPDSMTEKEEPGIHNPGDRVTWYTLFYPGLELGFFTTNTGGGGLIRAKPETPDHALAGAISPGAALRDVILQAGPPHSREGDTFYWSDGAGYAELYVTFSGGRVAEADYTVFVD